MPVPIAAPAIAPLLASLSPMVTAASVSPEPFWQRFGLQPVQPIRDGLPRPLITVAIPLFIKTDQDFALAERCLRSVLAHAWTRDDVEVLVVDDASPTAGVAEFIQTLGQGRIRYERNERNLFVTGNWRRCIDLARGEWIHLLHDDDFVYPGFYPTIRDSIVAHPTIGQIATQVLTSRDPTRMEGSLTMKFTADGPTIFPDWLTQVCEFSKLWHAGVVTKRAVYEEIGNWGFPQPQGASMALDWEFFVRTACSGAKTLFVPTVLAYYSQNSTATAIEHNQKFDNLTALTVMDRFQVYLGPEASSPLIIACAKFYLQLTWRHFVNLAQQYSFSAILQQVHDPYLVQLLEYHPESREAFANLERIVTEQMNQWCKAPEFLIAPG